MNIGCNGVRFVTVNVEKSRVFFVMFRFFCFSLLSITSVFASDISFQYEFEVQPKVLHVNLTYKPVVKDSTTFKYGSEFYGGMKDLIKSLTKLEASVKFRIDEGNNSVTFYHPQNKPVKIKYDIIDTHKPEQRVVGEMFRPISTDTYFFSLSHTLFLTPQVDEDLKKKSLVSVKLKGRQAFPLFFTGSPTLKPNKRVVLSYSDVMNALLTGATDLHVETRELGGITNYVVLRYDQNTTYNRDRFMKYFDSFLPIMTNFWGNLEGNYYSLVASKFQDITYHDISGTAFKWGFHVKYSGDTILASPSVVNTISHEIVHRYIGAGNISMGENNQWFNEGFTEFTTWHLLTEGGLLDKDYKEKQVKETYNKLINNPVNHTHNDDIMKHFWESKHYELLPYNRGALFAAFMERRIQTLHGSSKTYQDFMRSIKAFVEVNKSILTREDFIRLGSEFLPEEEIRVAFENYVLQGKVIPENLLF